MLPSPNIATQTPPQARLTIANAIDAHITGTVTIQQLAQWALKAYHARIATDVDDHDDMDDMDDEGDTDNDTAGISASEQLIVDALDALMFADDTAFALDHATLTSWRNRLRIAVV